jgi:hypothetical protein
LSTHQAGVLIGVVAPRRIHPLVGSLPK